MEVVAGEMAEREVYCPHCAYDLRGSASALCPECGRAVDRAALARVALPWPRRKQLGWMRAYWQTVWWATRRPAWLVAELAAPVSLRDARRFWAVTVLHAVAPIAVAVGIAMHHLPDVPKKSDWLIRASAAVYPLAAAGWPLIVVGVGALLWLFAATGATGYFCHPRRMPVERQDRAIALSYYACAPLATVGPLGLMFGLMAWVATRFNLDYLELLIGLGGAIWAGIVLLMGYFDALRVVRGVADRGWRFTTALAVGLPVIWVVLFGLLVVVLPAMVVYIVLLVMSSLGGGQ